MSDKQFEFEGMYSIVTRKDFRDELLDYYRNYYYDTDAFIQLADFAMTKGIECQELSEGRVVFYPHRSTRKRPACAVASEYMLDVEAKILLCGPRFRLYFMEAGKYDLAGAS